ncbi:MAG: biotin/lipoyl-containing protein, partial [Saprospiraceae bacterium]|nr:biotin/lipoyl-containing protein [Saprospiraceae bacterium]
MAEVIRMPRLSDTMEEGVIVGWLKKVGDKVEPGDILAEVETDKATMELESFHEGYLLHIGVEEGAVPVDGILAVIGEKDEDYQAALEAEGAPASNGQPTRDTKDPAPAEEQNETTIQAADRQPAPLAEAVTAPVAPATADGDRIKASPLARAMAAEAGIDLGQVKGSGDQGRIVKRDIEAYREQAPAVSHQAPAAGPAVAGHGEF